MAVTESYWPPPPKGRRSSQRWLDTPVEHIRTELLIKLALRDRVGLETRTLLAAQQEAVQPTIDALTTTAEGDGLVESLVARERPGGPALPGRSHPPPPAPSLDQA